MATTYLSPGVYVEEIPSAQQPIAGVGTNTVGFIGIVPDQINCPVPLSDEAFHRRVMARVAELSKVTKDELRAQLQQAIAAADRDNATVATAKVQFDQAKAVKLPADASDQDKAANAAGLAARKQALDAAEAAARASNQRRSDLQTQVDSPDDPRTRAEASVRRYDIVKFQVQAEVADSKLCTNFGEYVQRFGPVAAVDDNGTPIRAMDVSGNPILAGDPRLEDPARRDEVFPLGTPVPYSADDPAQDSGVALNPGHRALTHAVAGFFRNGGTRCFVARISEYNDGQIDNVLRDFESIDAIAIVAAPGVLPKGDRLTAKEITVWDKLVSHCALTGDRFAILDCPPDLDDDDGFLDVERLTYDNQDNALPGRSKNAAYYCPYLEVIDPAKQYQDQDPSRGVPLKHRGKVYVPPSGHMAGIYARTDEERGVHKAPANTPVFGSNDVKYYITKQKQALLNPQGVNCIRSLNGNIVVWGARTIGGDMNGEWKYINVRRLFLFLAESIDEGTQWVVFEPNDQALWGKIRRNVSAFLTNVWRTGALFGSTPEEAFYVKCDAETNPPEVRDVGQVVTEIGVAIVRPAEFVIFRITQSIGLKNP